MTKVMILCRLAVLIVVGFLAMPYSTDASYVIGGDEDCTHRGRKNVELGSAGADDCPYDRKKCDGCQAGAGNDTKDVTCDEDGGDNTCGEDPDIEEEPGDPNCTTGQKHAATSSACEDKPCT